MCLGSSGVAKSVNLSHINTNSRRSIAMDRRNYELSVSNELQLYDYDWIDKFALIQTKVVQIYPAYYIISKIKGGLVEMTQYGNRNSESCVCLDQENIVQWHWPNSKLENKICVTVIINQERYGWSCPLNFDQVQRKDLLLRNHNSDMSIIINYEVKNSSGQLVVIFKEAKQSHCNYKICNRTSNFVLFQRQISQTRS